MKKTDYIKWYFKYFIKQKYLHSRFFSIISEKMYSFFYKINNGFERHDRLAPHYKTSSDFLKLTYWLVPALKEKSARVGIPYSIFVDKETQKELPFDKAVELYISVIEKVRFAHFYLLYIEDEQFGYLINDRTERKAAFVHLLKKHPYLKDLMTWKLFLSMYTNESLKYTIKMTSEKMDNGHYSCDFFTINKKTKEVVDLPREITNPEEKVAKDLLYKYEEGIKLYFEHYRSFGD